MANSACFLPGLMERTTAKTVVTGHLPDISHLVARIGFYLKIKVTQFLIIQPISTITC